MTDARPVSQPTATVSVCVNADEQSLIREAAQAADMTVSAWCSARVAAALATSAARAATLKTVEEIEATFTPRGSRKQRVSMVMRQHDHAGLKDTATQLKTNAHAFAQAALLAAAAAEVEALPAPQRRILAEKRKAQQAAAVAHMMVSVPEDLVDVTEAEALSDLVRAIMQGMPGQIMGGQGVKVKATVDRMTARLAALPHVGMKLYVPEFDVRAIAFVLDVPAAALATTLVVKAAGVLAQQSAA